MPVWFALFASFWGFNAFVALWKKKSALCFVFFSGAGISGLTGSTRTPFQGFLARQHSIPSTAGDISLTPVGSGRAWLGRKVDEERLVDARRDIKLTAFD